MEFIIKFKNSDSGKENTATIRATSVDSAKTKFHDIHDKTKNTILTVKPK